MTSSKSLVVISDVHCGSKYAVCSESPEIEDGNNYKPSPNQAKLLTAWYDTIDRISQKPDALVINGEPIDGANRFSLGTGVWSTDINDQLNDAQKLLSEIKFKKLFFVRGSDYHVTRDATNHEKLLAERMKAVKYKSTMGNKTYADFEATFEAYGKHIHFTHHVGWSSWWMYRSTPVAKELIKAHFAAKESGYHTDVLVRSHVHYFVLVEFPHTVGFTNPAWKFPDGFLYRKGEPELPTIGNMEIIIEPNGEIITRKHLVDMEFKKPVNHL